MSSIVVLCLSLFLGCTGYWLRDIVIAHGLIAVLPFQIQMSLIIAFVGIAGVSILLFVVAAKGIAQLYKAQDRDWKKAAKQRSLFIVATTIALSCTSLDFCREHNVQQPLVYTVQEGEDIPIIGFGSYQIADNGDGTYTVLAKLQPESNSNIFVFHDR